MDLLTRLMNGVLTEVYVGSTKAIIVVLLLVIAFLVFEVIRLRKVHAREVESNRKDNEANRLMLKHFFKEFRNYAENTTSEYASNMESNNKSMQKLKEVIGNLVVFLTTATSEVKGDKKKDEDDPDLKT
ncbi:hypothetical protein [Proteus mirabilis]|uniref:hypothetical protein n=1 Tax=Proteus mirabilis TaxID=584 RepID=UPI0034D4699E